MFVGFSFLIREALAVTNSSLVSVQDSSELTEKSVEGKKKLRHRLEVGYKPVT